MNVKVVRTITYEGTEEQVRNNLRASLPVGTSQWGKSPRITIAHAEGTRFEDENAHRQALDGNSNRLARAQ